MLFAPGDSSKMKSSKSSSFSRLTSGLLSKLKLSNEMLSPYNLKGIQASLLAIGARRAEEDVPDDELNEFLGQIEGLVGGMKTQIEMQHNNAQSSLDSAKHALNACSITTATQSLTWWREHHLDCRNTESDAGAAYNDCLDKLTLDDETVNARYESFRDANVWPNSCYYTSTTAPGLSARRRSNRDYILAVRDAYQTRLSAWTSAHGKLINASLARNVTRAECIEKLNEYKTETSRCNEIQNDLETHACTEAKACETYMDCYTCKHDEVIKTEGTIKSAEMSYVSEWQGILRIQCLIAEIQKDTTTFDATACDTDYSGSLSDPVRVNYDEAIPDAPAQCTDAAVQEEIPGSKQFIEAYYTPMPAHTKTAECKASCCVYTDGCCYSFKYEGATPCCLETSDQVLTNCTATPGYGTTAGWVDGTCPQDAESAYTLMMKGVPVVIPPR